MTLCLPLPMMNTYLPSNFGYSLPPPLLMMTANQGLSDVPSMSHPMVLCAMPPLSCLKTESDCPPSIHAFGQDDDEYFEGELEQDPPESDPEIDLDLDIDLESDSDLVPPSSSLSSLPCCQPDQRWSSIYPTWSLLQMPQFLPKRYLYPMPSSLPSCCSRRFHNFSQPNWNQTKSWRSNPPLPYYFSSSYMT